MIGVPERPTVCVASIVVRLVAAIFGEAADVEASAAFCWVVKR